MKHCALIFLLISSDILQNQIYPNGQEGHFANSPLVDFVVVFIKLKNQLSAHAADQGKLICVVTIYILNM